MNQLSGKARVVVVTGTSVGAGSTVTSLRPEAGQVWIVLWATGEQNDGNVSCSWFFTDPETPAGAALFSVSLAANTPLAFGALAANAVPAGWGQGLKLNFSRYASFVFAASAAAKICTIKALVLEYTNTDDDF